MTVSTFLQYLHFTASEVTDFHYLVVIAFQSRGLTFKLFINLDILSVESPIKTRSQVKVLELISGDQWHHVATKDNHANDDTSCVSVEVLQLPNGSNVYII